MALSLSRPDPSSPDAVAAASFPTTRRGFEQSEVRDFLRMVAAELARLQERERYLDRELRIAQRGAPNPAVALDEEVVTRLLGEEAARILSTAREAASQIKVRAEDAAARLLREAADEAQRMREEAHLESARRRQDAAADAESEIEMAKQQGREMVNEARAYRERVLSELARRRELAREQIEQLVHGRDRLVQAFERARIAAVGVMSELTPLGEPAEYVNLALTTGPVPVMVPNQSPPARVAMRVAAPPAAPEPDATTALHRDAPAASTAVDDAGDGGQPPVVVALFAGEVILDVPSPLPADAGVADADAADTGTAETGTAETGTAETGTAETGTADTGTADTGTADAVTVEVDAAETDIAETELVETDIAETAMAETDMAETELVETDMVETAMVETDMLETDMAETAMVETDMLETDMAETDAAETDAAETDAAGTVAAESDITDGVVVDDADVADPTAAHADADLAELVTDAPAEGDGIADDVAPAGADEHELGAEAVGAVDAAAPEEPQPPVDADAVDDLFARLRAARAASVAERAAMQPTPTAPEVVLDATVAPMRPEPLSVFDPSPTAPEPSGEIDDSPFGRRDAALAPVIIACARKLKRVLADEQNDVLHALRRTGVVREIEPMLPRESEHGQRYAMAIAAELATAAAAGASSVSSKSRSELNRRLGNATTTEATTALSTNIVAPLRERLARAITAADGDNGELASLARAIYREWKIQHIDEHLDEVVRTAFGRGALAALDPGTPVRWVHDPRFAVCADCDDNSLSGVIGAGEPFATGQPCAPAHEGCRCMLATVAG